MANESGPKQPQNASGYGYNYGGNYAGYSAIGYAEHESGGAQVQRTLQDYLLILRERIWYIIVVFLVIFASALVFTLSDTKIFQSTTTVQIFRRDPTVIKGDQVLDNDIRSAEDLNTQIKIIESLTMIERVANRLTPDEVRAFVAPFQGAPTDRAWVARKIAKERKVIPQRLTLVVQIAYQHPDPVVAAKVANLFADEYLKNNSELRLKMQTKANEELQVTVADQQRRVNQLAQKLQEYKEANKTVSLDQRKDIVSDSLKTINAEEQKAAIALHAAEVRLNQIKEHRIKGADLLGLQFIASQPLINGLSEKLAANKIEIAKLSEQFRAKHPNMIAAVNTYEQTQRELQRAIDSVCEQVEGEYQSALRNHEQRKADLEKHKAEVLMLDRMAVEYNQLDREFQTQNTILQSIAAQAREKTMMSSIDVQNARVVDIAAPALKPISPNVPLNLGLGVVGGLGLGIAFAFFVAFIDDRVKSSFDIEGVVGLPLIGIIPQIKKMDAAEKAQIVTTDADRQVAEAFLTLHSSLRLKDESKNAKCILITSTVPGEGKSFTTTNLALTFAAHGEKVLIIDCDLRKPNIHKSFRLENLRGVIDVTAGKATLEEVLLRDVHRNLDVLPAGGRAKHPTQVLNSKGFEQMLADLKKRYDRIFIDTPPLAAVSDALVVLPLVDGSIFTIYFNKVRRKAAQFAAKKLLEANVPNFGAVLNGLNLAVSGYYYAQYYDKSYKDYYVVMAKNDGDVEK